MKLPTQKQRHLAAELGVDVGEGLTRKGVSQLIDGGLDARRQAASADVPNEFAGLVPRPTTDRRKAIIEAYRAARIGVGSVLIRRWNAEDNTVVVVVNDEHNNSLKKRLFSADGAWNDAVWLFNDGSGIVRQNEHYTLAYNPSTGYRHAMHAAYNIRDMLRQKYADVRQRLPYSAKAKTFQRLTAPVALKVFAPLVPAEYKYRNEYGEYWKTDAVTALVEAYVDTKG